MPSFLGRQLWMGAAKKCQLQRPTSAQRCLHEPLPSWLSRRQLNKVSTYLRRANPCGKMAALNVDSWGFCKEEGMSLSESIVITPKKRTHLSPCFCPMRGRRGASVLVSAVRKGWLSGGEPSATVILLRYPCASDCGGHSFSVL